MLAMVIISITALPHPAAAKESLGVFDGWAAFRDKDQGRCYAIAMPAPSRLHRDYQPYANLGTWPRKSIRHQLHIRLSRNVAPLSQIVLIMGKQRFALTGGGGDAWAQDKAMDAAIVAAMRSAGSMVVNATDANGARFSNTYNLTGVATAMDAAIVGCARL